MNICLSAFKLNTYMVALAALRYHSPRLQAVAQGSLKYSATMAVSTLCCQMRDAEGGNKKTECIRGIDRCYISPERESELHLCHRICKYHEQCLLQSCKQHRVISSLTSTDDCMALLTEAIKSSHPSVAECLELTVSSAFLLASGIGPSDALAATIIEGTEMPCQGP